MKLKDILGKVTKATSSPIGQFIQAIVPGAAAVGKTLETLNAVLPGSPVTPETPASEIAERIELLSPDKQAEIMEKEIELAIVESNNYAAVAIAQEQNNNATRPAIALQMSQAFVDAGKHSFQLVALAVLADTLLALTGHSDKVSVTDTVLAGLAWFVGAYGVPMMNVIVTYFAKRSDDKRTAAAASGVSVPPPTTNVFTSVVSAIRGK